MLQMLRDGALDAAIFGNDTPSAPDLATVFPDPDAAGRTVTRWSDNRAFQATPATILINPNEHLEYSETIATRDLSPGRVFTVEALVPAYPELDTKRKSLAAP